MDYNKLLLDLQSPKLKEFNNEGEQTEALPSKLYFGEAADSDEGEDLEDMDEDQIVAIYKEEGIFKRSREEMQEVKDF
jgi:hypothetical protein